MSKGKQRKNLIKTAGIALIPLVLASFVFTLPVLNLGGSDIALFSATLLFPEGGMSLLSGNLHENKENYNPHETDLDVSPESEIPSSQSSSSSSGSSSGEIPSVADGDKGPILESDMAVATGTSAANIISLSHGTIRNYTSLSVSEITSIISKPPDFTISKNSDIQVLIMHTHTTESYVPFDLGYYVKGSATRTTDLSQNMARVGDEVAKELTAAGIGVVHDTALHDYPSYTNSYTRSAATVKAYLAKYPTIKVVLDLHRDAIQRADGTWVKPVATINGKKAAQVMIISGCDNGTMNLPNWSSNLKFAALLNSTMEGMFPGLTRPVMFDYRKYNQDLTNGSMLLEFGSCANTLEEAVYSGSMVGKSLAAALKSTQK